MNVIVGLPGVTFDVAQLAAVGVKRSPKSVGSALARLAYGGLIRAGQEMRQAGSFAFAEDAAGFDEIQNRF